MGMLVYPEFRKAFDKAFSRLNMNQKEIVFYIYSNVENKFYDDDPDEQDKRWFKKFSISYEDLLERCNLYYEGLQGAELFDAVWNDIESLVTKTALFTDTKNKELTVPYLTQAGYKNGKIIVRVPEHISCILATNQMLMEALKLNPDLDSTLLPLINPFKHEIFVPGTEVDNFQYNNKFRVRIG